MTLENDIRAASEGDRGDGKAGDIPWLVFVDNDQDGLGAIGGLQGFYGATLRAEYDQVVVSGKKQLEQLLIDAGYHAAIHEVANTYSPIGRS